MVTLNSWLFSLLITWIHKTVLNSFSLIFIRLRKGEVEPKPTLVALSRDSGKRSSTGESDGFTDNEYSYTDDDTDGERLLTANKPPLVTRSADDVRYSIFFLNSSVMLIHIVTNFMNVCKISVEKFETRNKFYSLVNEILYMKQ